MKTNRLIIHELEKESKEKTVTYKSSDELIDIDDSVNYLVDQLHTAFEKSLTKYSRFDESNISNTVFLSTNKYLTHQKDDVFVEFSKVSLSDLTHRIEREPFATGGYYVFVDYEVNSYRFISIIILRNKDAFNIKWNKNKFSVGATENINIDKLAMGYRLNCNLYQKKVDRNYIGLVSNQGDKLSKYFINWVNADKVTDNKDNTKLLINVVKSLGPDDKSIDKDDFEKAVFEWINMFRKQNKNRIDVDSLSEYLYNDPLKIRNHATNTYKKDLDATFKGDASEINRLIRLRASTKGITVTIDTDKFDNEEVQIIKGVLIIKNKAIVESLQLQRERNDQQ